MISRRESTYLSPNGELIKKMTLSIDINFPMGNIKSYISSNQVTTYIELTLNN